MFKYSTSPYLLWLIGNVISLFVGVSLGFTYNFIIGVAVGYGLLLLNDIRLSVSE